MRALWRPCWAFLLCAGCVQGVVPLPRGSVTIAVVDDGIDMSHPELRQRIAVNPDEVPDNGVDDDHNGFVDDVRGYDFLDGDNSATPASGSGDPSHGTMMALIALRAGEAAGASSEAQWVALVKILPLRVANDSTVDADAAANAISYAGSRGGRFIVNLSLGTIRRSLPEALRAEIGRQREMLFVVAAGNQGKSIAAMRASLCRIASPNVVCVAAIDGNDRLATFPKPSNFGPLVDIAALGVGVPVFGSNGSRRVETGTSLAAATASGIAARVWSSAPALSAAEVAQALCAGARQSDALGGAVRCGIVDAARSLRWRLAQPRAALSLQLEAPAASLGEAVP
jgi:subtilisin family serine protease